MKQGVEVSKEENSFESAIDALKNNKITTLEIYIVKPSLKTLQVFYNALQQNTSLRFLEITFDRRGEKELSERARNKLDEIWLKIFTLRTLSIEGKMFVTIIDSQVGNFIAALCDINRANEIRTLESALKVLENNVATVLNLNFPSINTQTAFALAKNLEKNTALKYFSFTSDKISIKDFSCIVESLKNHPKIFGIELKNNKISSEAVNPIATLLKINKRIRWLNLFFPNANPTDKAEEKLFSAVGEDHTLIKLSLEQQWSTVILDGDKNLLLQPLKHASGFPHAQVFYDRKAVPQTEQLSEDQDDSLRIPSQFHHKAGNIESLINLLGSSLYNPDLIYLRRQRLVLSHLKNWPKALEVCEEILKQNPTNTEALIRKGNVLLKLDKMNEAIVIYEQVLKQDPSNVEALIHKADALTKLGKIDEALACYYVVVDLEPKKDEEPDQLEVLRQHQLNALYQLGVIAQKQERISSAIGYYQQVIKIDPEFLCPDNNLKLQIVINTLQGKKSNSITQLQQTAKKNTALHKIVKDNWQDTAKCEQALKKAIKSGCTLQDVDGKDATVLHLAATKPNPKLIEQLLALGADVNAQNKNGQTPLMLAILAGNYDNVVILLAATTLEIDRKDGQQETALHHAAAMGDVKTVTALVNNKATLNAENYKKQTPVHIAIANNRVKTAQALLQLGANANAVDNQGNTLLHIAALNGLADMLRWLMAYYLRVNPSNESALSLQNNNGDTLLHCAVSSENKETVLVLLKAKADPNCKNKLGDRPLHIAAEKGNAEITTIILEYGASLDTIHLNNNNQSPLHIAIQNNSLLVMEILLSHIKNRIKEDEKLSLLQGQDQKGDTPLHLAATQGSLVMVQALLSQPIPLNTNVVNNKGETPLHLAAGKKSVEVVRLLLKHHAKIDKQDGEGKTPIALVKVKSEIKMKSDNNNDEYQSILTIFEQAKKQQIYTIIQQQFIFHLELKKIPFMTSKETVIKGLKIKLMQVLESHELLRSVIVAQDERLLDEIGQWIGLGISQAINAASTEQKSFYEDLLKIFGSPATTKLMNEAINNAVNTWDDKSITQNIPFSSSTNTGDLTQKERAFRWALKDGLRLYFDGAKMLIAHKLERGHDWLDKALEVEQTLAPMIGERIGGIKGAAIATAGNLAGKLISLVRDKKADYEAKNLVKAFANYPGNVTAENVMNINFDRKELQKLCNYLITRYKDQINVLTVSISGQDPKPQATDGLIVLANCIVERIVKHILANRNEFYGESSKAIGRVGQAVGSFLFEKIPSIFLREDNYTEKERMPLLDRCHLAILQETEGQDAIVQLDNQPNTTWYAGGVLVKTGIKLMNTPQKLYTLKEITEHEKYGFCCGTAREAIDRDFNLNMLAIDRFAVNKATQPEENKSAELSA